MLAKARKEQSCHLVVLLIGF
uniref:Uncharacterized protein n=1 Tax=Rhizophora mucronata TaxID=61149 RepID=A0A2P2QRJ0_RHIMU